MESDFDDLHIIGGIVHFELPACYLAVQQSSHTVSGRPNVEKIDLIDLVCMNNYRQLRGVCESHFANSKCPKHYLKKVFIGYSFVPFYSGYSGAENRRGDTLLSIDIIYSIPEVNHKF